MPRVGGRASAALALLAISCGSSESGGPAGGAGGSDGGVGRGGAAGSVATGGTTGSGGTVGGGSSGAGGSTVCAAVVPAESGALKTAFAVEPPVLHSVAASCDGSFAITGITSRTMALPRRDGTELELTLAPNTSSSWIARLDSEGYALWAQKFPGGGGNAGPPFAETGPAGSVVGVRIGPSTSPTPVTFGAGGPNETTLTPRYDSAEGCIVRYDADGNFQWVKHLAALETRVSALSLAPDGTTYALVQELQGVELVIGPGEIDFRVTARESALVAISAGGRFLSATRIAPPAGSVLRAFDGGVVVSGQFVDGTLLGAGTPSQTELSTQATTDSFVAVFTPELEVVRTTILGGMFTTFPLADGSFVASRRFSGTVTLGAGEPNETTLTAVNASGDDTILARYDTGGALAWAIQLAGTNRDAVALAAASDGSVWFRAAAGESDQPGSLILAPGAPDSITFPFTNTTQFVARFTPTGAPAWLSTFDSDGYLFVSAFAASARTALAVGQFSTTIKFGSVPTSLEAPGGQQSAFLALFGP